MKITWFDPTRADLDQTNVCVITFNWNHALFGSILRVRYKDLFAQIYMWVSSVKSELFGFVECVRYLS